MQCGGLRQREPQQAILIYVCFYEMITYVLSSAKQKLIDRLISAHKFPADKMDLADCCLVRKTVGRC